MDQDVDIETNIENKAACPGKTVSLCSKHAVHWGINPPCPPQKYHPLLSCQTPLPLNLQTVQTSRFRQFPPLHWFFMNPAHPKTLDFLVRA